MPFLYAIVCSQLPNSEFLDFDNYMNFIKNSEGLLNIALNSNIFIALANEPIWLLVNYSLKIFLNDEAVFRLIIFISSFIFSKVVIKNSNGDFLFIIIILLTPQFLKNYITHIRQGFAISLFLYSWFLRNNLFRIMLFIIVPFIHTSFFFVYILISLSYICHSLKFSLTSTILFYIFASFAISLSVTELANYFGARQSNEYNFTMTSSSGLGFIFWFSILIFLLLCTDITSTHYLFFLIFYLTSYWYIEVTARIFESSLFLVFYYINQTTRKYVFYSLILVNFILQWYIKLNLPFGGFKI